MPPRRPAASSTPTPAFDHWPQSPAETEHLECAVWLRLVLPFDDGLTDEHAAISSRWAALAADADLGDWLSPAWENGRCHITAFRAPNHGAWLVGELKRLLQHLPTHFPLAYGVIHMKTDGGRSLITTPIGDPALAGDQYTAFFRGRDDGRA